MTLKTRLMWRFLLWLFLLLALILLLYLLVVISFFGINFPGKEDPYVGDVLKSIKKATRVEEDQLRLTAEAERELDRLEAWLQILDADGKEIYSYNLPPYLSQQYTPGELSDEKRKHRHIHTWYGSVEGRKFTWVLGYEKDFLLHRVAEAAIIHGKKVQLPDPILNEIEKEDGWLQLLNESGQEIYSYRRPPSQPDRLTAGELSGLLARDWESGYQIRYLRDQQAGRDWTWLLAKPVSQMDEAMQKMERMLNTYLLLLLLATAGIALLFGRRLGTPLLHMMHWIKNLSNGELQEPKDRRGNPISQSPAEGNLRRPFRVYQEVIDALQSLTESLQKNEQDRARLEQSREEWITGVSHDLKTPLSSIKGYADLLATDRFTWSKEEVQQFAATIQDKSTHMEQLLEDLSLTFRLKNDALPLHIRPVNVAELIRRAAIDLVNDPQSQNRNIELIVPDQEVKYPLDPSWFKRAIDNLIANAVIHNPPGTRIRLHLSTYGEEKGIRFPGLLFQVEDDGHGMDEQTVAQLFDRYYRGTSTGSEKGTGLGMAIAQQLVSAHGGKISVSSQLHVGTRIEVRLPPKN